MAYGKSTVASLILGAVCATAASEDTRNWHELPDFSALREEIGWREDFRDICEIGRPVQNMLALMDNGNPQEAARIGRDWLERCPVDVRIHHETFVALTKSGEAEEAEAHLEWTQGLMTTIAATGDGKTPDTAFETISVGEGYAVLHLLRLQLVDRSTVNDETGHPVADAMAVKYPDGPQFTMYFSPKAHFARVRAAVSRMSPELLEKMAQAIGNPGDDPDEQRAAIRQAVQSFPQDVSDQIDAALSAGDADVTPEDQ